MPAPSKQFSKSAIELGTVTRKWKSIPAQLIAVGDIIPDVGEVAIVSVSANVALQNISGKSFMYKFDQEVLTFTNA